MIPAPVKEPNTVYTCLKSLDKTFRESLRQENAVVTFDEGIYCEAKRIQWAISPELDNVIARLGGFHRVRNILGVIGKRMTESVLWIFESRVTYVVAMSQRRQSAGRTIIEP